MNILGIVSCPELFTIYINNLEEVMECKVFKFADDMKIDGKACFDEDIVNL